MGKEQEEALHFTIGTNNMADTRRDEVGTTTNAGPQMQNLMVGADANGFDGQEPTECDQKKSVCERQDTDGGEMDLIDFNGQTTFSQLGADEVGSLLEQEVKQTKLKQPDFFNDKKAQSIVVNYKPSNFNVSK